MSPALTGDTQSTGDTKTACNYCIVTGVTTVTSNLEIQRACVRARAQEEVSEPLVSPVTVVTDLHRLAEALASGAELSAADRTAAAEALRRSIAPSKFSGRDQQVVDCLQQFYGGRRSLRDASEEMAAALGRYHATPWLRDRRATECPSRIAGGAQGAFWLILKTVDRPLSADRIRRIVGQFEVPHAVRDEFSN